VKSIHVNLDDDQLHLLQDLSDEEQHSYSDLIREALTEYFSRRGLPGQPLAVGPRRTIPEEKWQSEFRAALDRIRSGIDPNWSPEEIEADITAARDEARLARPPSPQGDEWTELNAARLPRQSAQ